VLHYSDDEKEIIRRRLAVPNAERIFYVRDAFLAGFDIEEVFELTRIDRWFLENIVQIVNEQRSAMQKSGKHPDVRLEQLATERFVQRDGAMKTHLVRLKKLGFSDRQIGLMTGHSDNDVRAARHTLGVIPTYRLVDTCAAEFEAYTPYYYSTYGDENERRESGKKKIIILGGGPNRIGQGIEFDYCCVHAAFRAEGARLRDDHGELQPGDRLDRLRHFGQALLRAAHARRTC
jgi:carbamoyl-phosphate synthase large subunit